MSKKRFKSKNDMENCWTDFKDYCDNKTATIDIINTKDLVTASAEVKRPVTYTIEGFCRFAGLSRAAFYADYDSSDKFKPIIERMRDECEVDQREKFEQGVINPKLAGMWMSKYDGYTQKVEQNIDAKNTIAVAFEDQALKDYSV